MAASLSSLETFSPLSPPAPLVRVTEVDDAASELLAQVLPVPLHAVRQRGDGGLSPTVELQVTVGVEHGAREDLICPLLGI